MATPAEIAEASNCYRCIGDQQAALLYVFATIAGMTPEQIQTGSSCFKCIGDPMSALVYLADQILQAGSGGATGCVPTTSGDPEGVLVSTCTPALAVDPATSAIYLFTGVAGTSVGWALKV